MMISPKDARELGMYRRIPRRDFLNGVAVGAAGLYAGLRLDTLAAQEPPFAPELAADYYPPALTGLRGQHVGSFEDAHRVRDGAYVQFPRVEVDTGQTYDLVVVGAGISGLAAAYFFRKALGRDRTVLLLDNHDDFGGHAKRNEFRPSTSSGRPEPAEGRPSTGSGHPEPAEGRYRGRLYIGYGGTMGISTPFPYSYVAKSLIGELGIQVERASEFSDRDLYRGLGLGRGMFFNREAFGEDRLIAGYGALPWPEFFARAPLSEQVRKDLVRLHVEKIDYMADLTLDEKAARLAKMSYQDYLLTIARITPDALPFFLGQGGRNNKRVDTMPALEAARGGSPGFDGLKLPLERLYSGSGYQFHHPDGGATVARLLVNRLVPDALPGDLDMEKVTLAKVDYAKLDTPGAPVRLRLNSTAVRVEHDGPPEKARAVRVAYVRGGRVHLVRARACVLACFNSIVRFLAPELPADQKHALAYAVKVPLLYTNVFVRNWRAFTKLGVSGVSAPCMYYPSMNLDVPVSLGGYQCSRSPDDPIVVHLSRNPNKPGLPRREQHKAGMYELLSTPFETIEYETRRQFARILGPGGFDPAADILAITANRWPHGYAYTYDTLADPDVPPEQRPHVVGRRPFGLIAIANSDAGAAAFINVAIDEAHRAVQEVLIRQGLT